MVCIACSIRERAVEHRRNCADSIFGPPHELAVEFRRATGSGLDLVRSFLRSTFRIRRGPTDRMSSKLLSVVLMNNALDVASQPRRAHFSQVKGRHASATHPPVTRGPDTETKLDGKYRDIAAFRARSALLRVRDGLLAGHVG
jgi:hypothetical protein